MLVGLLYFVLWNAFCIFVETELSLIEMYAMMNELEVALKGIDWSKPQDCFASIAEILMGKYVIEKGGKRYAIVEIEFYVYSNGHKDYITYPRDCKAGRWYFHQSGVDLTFESGDISITKDKNGNDAVVLLSNPHFGGILIRGLCNLNPTNNEEPYILGPLKCVDVLWDEFDALAHSVGEYPVLNRAVQADNLNTDNLFQCKRCINIKEDDNYRFERIKTWAKRIGIEATEDELIDYRNEMFDNPKTYRYRFFNLIHGENPHTFTKIPSSARPKY